MLRHHYKASRGGHAPGHLRDAFLEYIDETGGLAAMNLNDKVTIYIDEGEPDVSLRWLTGQLWNCSDIVPSFECGLLDLLQGSTYAMAVRRFRAEACED